MLQRLLSVVLIVTVILVCLFICSAPDSRLLPTPALIAGWILLTLPGSAIGLVLLKLFRRRPSCARQLTALISAHAPYTPPRPRRAALTYISGLPDFGLTFGCLLVLVVLFVSFQPQTPVGLEEHLQRRQFAQFWDNRSSDTLGVYIDAHNAFFINGQQVARKMLPVELKRALGRHATTAIYFEADENAEYEQCIYAMDTIKGLGADLVWTTPLSRAQWNKNADW